MTRMNHDVIRTLVLGRDATGKSTLLNNISQYYGDLTIEATSTPIAKRFKRDNLTTLVGSEFVLKREEFFLDLCNNEITDPRLKSNHVTTSDRLVTYVSHAVMRSIVAPSSYLNVNQLTDNWINDIRTKGLMVPSILALTYTPQDVANQRIIERQEQGDTNEVFWGFNSPFFLNRYQQALEGVIDVLSENEICHTLKLNTSLLNKDETFFSYQLTRNLLTI